MWEDTRHSGSVGLAMVHAGGSNTIPEVDTIHCLGGHRKVGDFAPLINDKSPAMYVQTANGANVTDRRGRGERDAISTEDIVATFKAKFPYLDADTLNRLHVVYQD